VSVSPSPVPSAPASTPQPAAPAPSQPQVPLQPAATTPEVQPAAPAPVVQPAATAPVVQPAAPVGVVQPAATAPVVQPVAPATPASTGAPTSTGSAPATPISPATPIAVPSGTPPPPSASTTNSVPSSVTQTVAKDAAGNADLPTDAARDYLRTRASNAGRILRTSDSAAARSQAAKDLPRFARDAQFADKAANGAAVLGMAAGAATDYANQRAGGHSPADSAGYAAARQGGGVAGAVAASALCVPADAVSLGFAEGACLFGGNVAGNLVGGWVYDLARRVHNNTASPTGSSSHVGAPEPNNTVQFVLPL